MFPTLTKDSKPEEVRQAWRAALTNGEYKQGSALLCYRNADGRDSFCCLGVLSDLAVKAGVIPAPTVHTEYNGPDGHEGLKLVYESDEYHLSDKVREWAGFNEEEGVKLLSELEDMNDKGEPFGTLAGIIKLSVKAFQ